MKRKIDTELELWKTNAKRKPLLLVGARQVGKTTALKRFGKGFDACHYFDLERDKASLEPIFSGDINPEKILQDLALYQGSSIGTEDLIVLDEVQAIPRAITSLKYFQQDTRQPICAAGSHLGVTMSRGGSRGGFPVGKVDLLHMFPMTFLEFLEAKGEENLVQALLKVFNERSMSLTLHRKSLEQLRFYFVTGGMPEVVSTFACEFDPANLPDILTSVRSLQNSLVEQLCRDFGKYADQTPARKIEAVFRSVPGQLGRYQTGSSSRYLFKDLKYNGKRARRYDDLQDPLEWLSQSGLIHKVHIVDNVQSPISSQYSSSLFKLFLHDIGLLGAMAAISPSQMLNYDFGTWKGYFVENFVLQELVASGIKSDLVSWKKNNSEVEFVCSTMEQGYVPIEVKASINTKAKSLGVFQKTYEPNHVVRVTGNRFGYNADQRSINFSLPMAGMLRAVDYGGCLF